MKKMTIMLVVLVALLLTAGGALAMASLHYRIDWHALVSGGGAPTDSTHYEANFTVGQTVAASSSSAHYKMSTGYWQGVEPGHQAYLPTTLKRSTTH